jgi:hypothetical protein
MIGMEHQTLKNEPCASAVFRSAYRSLRLQARRTRRQRLAPKYRPADSEYRVHLTCCEPIQVAVRYAISAWALSKWPDPIIGEAKRKLARLRSQRIAEDNQANLDEKLNKSGRLTESQKAELSAKNLR